MFTLSSFLSFYHISLLPQLYMYNAYTKSQHLCAYYYKQWENAELHNWNAIMMKEDDETRIFSMFNVDKFSMCVCVCNVHYDGK